MIPWRSLAQAEGVYEKLAEDKDYLQTGKSYLEAAYTNPLYVRISTVYLKAFRLHPKLQKPQRTTPVSEWIYELRSYESHTEKIFANKVQMFNEGDEIGLFKRLGFNAVFYGEVIAGDRMPNLMYMTSFANQADRDAHWQTFSNDPQWKTLLAMPAYKNNVSHIDIYLLHATAYSAL